MMGLFFHKKRRDDGGKPNVVSTVASHTGNDRNVYIVARTEPIMSGLRKAASLSPEIQVLEDSDDVFGAAVPLEWIQIKLPYRG